MLFENHSGADEIQNVQVVLWLQVKHAGYLCNSFDSWLRKMSLVYGN